MLNDVKPDYAPLDKIASDACVYIETFTPLVYPPPCAEIRDHTGKTYPIFDATTAGTAKFAHAEHAPCYLTLTDSQSGKSRYVKAIHIVPTSPEIVIDACYRCGGTALRMAATEAMAECFECRRCAARMFLRPFYAFPRI